MKRGQSFVVASRDEQKKVLTRAKRIGLRMTSRKVDGEGYRIWKV